MKTQHRILQASTRLFNHYGVETVSIGKICNTLDISPGNFTYHFKKKENLIESLFLDFSQKLDQNVKNFPDPANPKSFAIAAYDLVALVYDYRFLFLGASFLIENEFISQGQFNALIENAKQKFARLVNSMIDNGVMTGVNPPYSVRQLVDSVWWQWLGWLLSMQIRPSPAISTKNLLTEEVFNIIFISNKYLDSDFQHSVVQELKKIPIATLTKNRLS